VLSRQRRCTSTSDDNCSTARLAARSLEGWWGSPRQEHHGARVTEWRCSSCGLRVWCIPRVLPQGGTGRCLRAPDDGVQGNAPSACPPTRTKRVADAQAFVGRLCERRLSGREARRLCSAEPISTIGDGGCWPRVPLGEREVPQRSACRTLCARSSDERRVGQDTLRNEKPKEATGNTLLATVERSLRLRKWIKALRSSDRSSGRSCRKAAAVGASGATTGGQGDAVTRHHCLRGKGFEGHALLGRSRYVAHDLESCLRGSKHSEPHDRLQGATDLRSPGWSKPSESGGTTRTERVGCLARSSPKDGRRLVREWTPWVMSIEGHL